MAVRSGPPYAKGARATSEAPGTEASASSEDAQAGQKARLGATRSGQAAHVGGATKPTITSMSTDARAQDQERRSESVLATPLTSSKERASCVVASANSAKGVWLRYHAISSRVFPA